MLLLSQIPSSLAFTLAIRQTALDTPTDDLWRHLDQSGSVQLLFLDLTAVFDTVDYHLMTHCLTNVGIQRTALQWLSSFLYGEGKRVVLGEELSWQHPLEYGALQEVILSPFLFNIYKYLLTQKYCLGCHQYADSTQLHLLMDNQPESSSDVLERALQAMTG